MTLSLYHPPNTTPFDFVEFDTHPERFRILATVTEGMQSTGPLRDLYTLAEQLWDQTASTSFDEGWEEGRTQAEEKAVDALESLQGTLSRREEDAENDTEAAIYAEVWALVETLIDTAFSDK